jgi:transcriptional regulator with XRE-family HTH domain
MNDLYEHVGKRIRTLRDAYDSGRGLSQEKLGEAMGVTTNTISRWETATYRPDLADLDRLAKFFGVSILTFLPEAGAPQEKKAENEALTGLIETARELLPEDVEEVRRFAEFRRATRMNRSPQRPRRGRPPGRRR